MFKIRKLNTEEYFCGFDVNFKTKNLVCFSIRVQPLFGSEKESLDLSREEANEVREILLDKKFDPIEFEIVKL